jgi:hypothetical protein
MTAASGSECQAPTSVVASFQQQLRTKQRLVYNDALREAHEQPPQICCRFLQSRCQGHVVSLRLLKLCSLQPLLCAHSGSPLAHGFVPGGADSAFA